MSLAVNHKYSTAAIEFGERLIGGLLLHKSRPQKEGFYGFVVEGRMPLQFDIEDGFAYANDILKITTMTPIHLDGWRLYAKLTFTKR